MFVQFYLYVLIWKVWQQWYTKKTEIQHKPVDRKTCSLSFQLEFPEFPLQKHILLGKVQAYSPMNFTLTFMMNTDRPGA